MKHVAVDLGASGGKIYLGEIAEDLKVQEIHRFDNWPVKVENRYVWNIEKLVRKIINSLKKVGKKEGTIDSIAIDTWGVDFGLLKNGELLRKPDSYRDPRLSSTLPNILKEVTKKEIFESTGINHWNIANSLWQYHYLSRNEPELLQSADRIVMIPQLISSMLGDGVCGEETIASTTQMLNPETRNWAKDLLERLDLSTEKLPEIEEPGTEIGRVRKDIAQKIGSSPKILLPASHDTASAVAGMSLRDDKKAFLSTGSWFIVGLELENPVLTEEAFKAGSSNEMGIEKTSRFLKNINGFYIFEECRREWKRKGHTYQYDKLLEKASNTKRFGPLIDPDNETFTIEGNMPEKLISYCRETNQKLPEGKGEIVRCILESLSLKTAITLEDLIEASGISSSCLHLGGGGVRNEIFCQILSSATQMPVYAGPIEAAAVGNILTQTKACSEIEDIKEGRKLVQENFKIQKYEPEKNEKWSEAKSKMRELIEK
ncbi:rhamnulokinase [candidate division MSBL1 archaeon SCGC-AAA259A05]|uniref:Rhamnulokinase n=1 Tax=candidate division MSBL1 archaeon SCGC-AAA259A05 TaxID=1698259 RepID=A0A133UBV6_9EURY|nr:rhamnulokinase [candidate division MSBL1 archaeon SCGC-AAA259A05]